MGRKLLLGALLALLGTGGGVAAAPATDDAKAGAPSAKASKARKPKKSEPPIEVPPEEPTPEAAQLHHDVAQEQYEAGHYEKALGEFEVADRYKSTPARKMGIARCLEKLGRIPEALEYYKLVAKRSPDPFDADEARRRIKALTPKPSAAEMGADPFAEADPEKKPDEPPPPPPDEPPPSGKGSRQKPPSKAGPRAK